MVLCVLKIKYAFVSSLYFYKQILSVNPFYIINSHAGGLFMFKCFLFFRDDMF